MGETHTATTPIEVQVAGRHATGIEDYARDRISSALRFARGRVLRARVRITRHADPAVDLPVTAQANVDVNGKLVRAQVRARGDQEAVDRLEDRLRRRLQHYLRRTVGRWEDRRGGGAEPNRRPPHSPRPPEERQIIRHKSYTLGECTIDEAAFDMEVMDYDFHLFTELGTGQDSVLYRDHRDGYRLAQARPRPEALARHSVPVTVSETPAPVLSTDEAVQRMAALDYPFLFYVDGERGRGALLYHRYDGNYGLITPADAGGCG